MNEYQAPHSPLYTGHDLFGAVEHFMCWIISLDQKPKKHRDILRNLERILHICEVGAHGHFLNALEQKRSFAILHHLMTGLDNGQETWDDILPATQLMLIHLESNNPKAHAIGQTVELRCAYHDKTKATDELSALLKNVIEMIIFHFEHGVTREEAEHVSAIMERYLQQPTWGLEQLEQLKTQLLPWLSSDQGKHTSP